MKVKTVIICLIFNLFSCRSFVSEEKLSEILARDAVFGRENIITALAGYSREKEIVIFGETHYLQQHQEFIVDYMNIMHSAGIKLFLYETNNAYGYVINEYIRGNLDEIPQPLRYIDNYIIEGFREINSTLQEDERIKYAGIDMNHWPEAAAKTVEILSGLTDLPPEILKIGKLDFFDDTYQKEIKTAVDFMKKGKQELVGSMGERWYDIFISLLTNELKSIDYRNSPSDKFREQSMFEMTENEMAHAEKALLNTGMYHAQKQHALGTKCRRIAQLLEESGHSIISISFFPAKAELKKHFYDTELYSMDVRKASANDLGKLLADAAGNRMGFLPLSDPLFSNEKITVTLGNTTTLTYPAEIFDAIITFPEGRIPDSMLEFEL